MEKKLTLQEKEERWINAIDRKNIDNIRTKDEYWFELETYQVLFEDNIIEFTVEYGNEYGIHFKDEAGEEIRGGLTCGYLDIILDYPFEKLEAWDEVKHKVKEKTLREYISKYEFPINFKTWEH